MPKGVPNKRYTGEFKQEVVETMQREKLSHKLVIDVDAVVVAQVVVEPAVAFVRALPVDLFDPVCQAFVLCGSMAQLPGRPFVIGRAGHMEQPAGQFDGIAIFRARFPDRRIDRALSYLR